MNHDPLWLARKTAYAGLIFLGADGILSDTEISNIIVRMVGAWGFDTVDEMLDDLWREKLRITYPKGRLD